MSSLKSLGVFSVLILALVMSSFALQENFDVFSATQNIAACSHSITTNSLTIRNTGDVESSYSLTGTGNIGATYSESLFSLKPGESKIVFIYLTPGQTGTYQIKTAIRTIFGLEKTLLQNVQVQSCANIQLNVKTPSLKVNPCSVSQFSFDLKNTGDYAETYDISSSGLEGYTALSTNKLTLNPGETKQIDIFANPDCSIYGTKEMKLSVLSETSKFLAETNVVLDIQRNYDYSVIMPSQISVCNLKQTSIPVAIKNDIDFTNQYEISVRGPSWLKNDGIVELNPKSSGITQLTANPSNPGSYLAYVSFKSVRGNVVKAGYLNITVDKCYSTDVNIENPSDIIVTDHTATYKITVKNDGTKDDTYDFQLESPEWVSANAVKQTVKAGETKTFMLTANPKNATGNFIAKFLVLSSETKTARLDSIRFSVISLENAYKASINTQNTRVLYGQNVIPVEIQNNGVLPAVYDISLNGPTWSKLTQNSLSLNPKEKGIVYIQTNAANSEKQGDYESQVVINVRNEQIGFLSKFNIKLRQLTVWQELQLFVMKYLYYIIAAAVVLILLIFFAIFGRRMAKGYRNWRIKRHELAKIRAQLKARKKEEKLAKKLLKKSKRPTHVGRKLFGSLLILMAFLLILGGVVSLAGYTPIITQMLNPKQDEKFSPIIKVDSSNLEAYGNTVIIRGVETTIPVIVKNNYNKTLIFDVQTDKSWIQTDTKRIELESGENAVVNLRVTPDSTTKGVYKITVSASLENDNKIFKEDVVLNIKQGGLLGDLLDYVWYVTGGLVVLILGIIIFRKKIPVKEETPKIEGFQKIKYPALRKVDISLPKKK